MNVHVTIASFLGGNPDYFMDSSCFLIILRTISPPMEPASREVRSPL